MKNIRNFKVEDFKGSGQYLIRVNEEEPFAHIPSTSYLNSAMVRVGYLKPTTNSGREYQRACLVYLSDGWVIDGGWYDGVFKPFESKKVKGSKQLLVDYLNDKNLSQLYRFATPEEIIRVITYQILISEKK